MSTGQASDEGSQSTDILQLALSLERLDKDLFRSVMLYTPRGARGTFGGQLVAHALVAAQETIDDVSNRRVHSLHSNFLTPGVSTEHIYYRVRRVRDGKTFATRTVSAFQNGEMVYVANVSFHAKEAAGLAHATQLPSDAPTVEAAVSEYDLLANFVRDAKGDQIKDNLRRKMAQQTSILIRYGLYGSMKAPVVSDVGYAWIKAQHFDAVTDVKLHRALAFFVSDFTLALSPVLPHGFPNRNLAMLVSLDHTVYFHDDFNVGDWFLYETRSHWANHNRGLAMGRVYTRDGGRLVMTVIQEALVRMEKGFTSVAKL